MPTTRSRSLFSFLRRRRNRRRTSQSQSNQSNHSQYESVSYQNPISHPSMNQFVTFRAPSLHATRECPICLEHLGDQHVTTGQCLHLLHATCLMTWLNQDPQLSCPVCRHPLVTDSTNFNFNTNYYHYPQADSNSDANSDSDSFAESRATNFDSISGDLNRLFVDISFVEDGLEETSLDIRSVDALIEGETWPPTVFHALTFDDSINDDVDSEEFYNTSEEDSRYSINDEWSDYDDYEYITLDPCRHARRMLSDLGVPSETDEILHSIRSI